MLIERLRLQNIKCFGDTEFSFLKNDNSVAQWITILGENATGKTVTLQSLALLISGSRDAQKLLQEPSYWVRENSVPGIVSCTIIPRNKDFTGKFTFKEGKFRITRTNIKKPIDSGFLVTGDKNITVKYKKFHIDDESGNEEEYIEPKIFNKPSIIQPGLDYPFTFRSFSFSKGFFGAGYGTSRKLSIEDTIKSSELSSNDRDSGFSTMFNSSNFLSFTQWIHFLDYKSEKNDKKAISKLHSGIKAINNLLPEGVEFDRVNLRRRGRIHFSVQGRSVPATALSDGYRSVLALGGDLIWRLINAFPDSDDPMKEEGVVLIDELDIHLHPRWQAWIAQKLRSAFPNIQFIVATHSPLVAMGAYWNGETGELRDDVLTLKLEINDGKASVQRIDDNLAAMDINRALESPAFGMVAPRPPEVEKKIDRYDKLLEKEGRTEGEQTEFQQLQQFMAEARPIGGKPSPGSLEAKLESYLRRNLP